MAETKLGMTDSELVQTALTSFASWLTTRRESITLGAKHEAPPAAEALKEFLDFHNIEAANLTPEHFDVWTETLA